MGPTPARVPLQAKAVSIQRVVSLVSDSRVDAESFRLDVPNSHIDVGGAHIRIRASMDKVLAVVKDYAEYKDILPRITKSQILGRRGRATDVYMEAPVLRGLVRAWGVARFAPPQRTGDGGLQIEGKLVKGNLDGWWGTWKLTPCGDDCTVLRLEMFVDPSLPVPPEAVSEELEWAADKAVTAVRDVVELGESAVKSD
jgi:ribosome-associated toxin RatA of RatAB toxin-antitoxin module